MIAEIILLFLRRTSMEIKLDIGNIRGPIKLLPWEKKTPPNPSGNLMNSIVSFARFMGLLSIPQTTLARLQNDEQFRICFTPTASVSYVSTLYDEKFGKSCRERLLAILIDPDKVMKEDLIKGFGIYLNNFHCLMPGGYFHDPGFIDPEFSQSHLTTLSRVDEILREKGLMERAVELGNKKLAKISYTPEELKDRVEHYKICLVIFNEMIGRYGYRRDDLIR
jgi:hypothetical protein